MTSTPLTINTTNGARLQEALDAIYQEKPLEGGSRVARAASYITVMALSALADIPFIPVSMPLGKVWGPLCALGNSVTFFVLDYWTSKGLINPLFGAKTRAHWELLQGVAGVHSPCRTARFVAFAFFIALLAQTPHVLATMKYNEDQYKVAAGIVLLLAGAFLPLRSLQLSLEELAGRVFATKQEKDVNEVREKLVGLVDSGHEAFLNKGVEEKCAFIEGCNEAEDRTLALTRPEETRPSHLVRSLFNYSGMGLGALLALTLEYTSAEYTFVETKKQVWDNNIVAGTFAGLTVASTAHLIGLSVLQTTQRIFNFCGNLVTGERARNLSWQMTPKLAATLTAGGFLMNLAALGPNFVIWDDFYRSNAVEHALLANAVCSALFLLFFTSTLDVIDEIAASSLTKGTEEERAIFKIHREFQEVKRLMRECPPDELKGYLQTTRGMLERLGIEASPGYGAA